jgi:superfamily II DNA or RNA helicase
MPELSVQVNSHNFTVTRLTPRGRAAVESFARRYVQYGFSRGRGSNRPALKVFATATEDRNEFRFHIHQFKEFQQHLELNYLTGPTVEFTHSTPPLARKVELIVKDKWTTRDYQEPVIEYGVADDYFQKLVEIQTGKGKSYCAMRIASMIGARMVIIVKAQFMDKWVDDVHKTYEIEIEDLMVVRGSNQLQALLMLAKEGELESKIVLISNKTMQNWLKLYERFRGETLGMGYDCMPSDFFEVLEAGFRLIDEVHMDFHLNFKMDLYTNIQKSLSLSATLISDDPFVQKMYEMTYPPTKRFSGMAYHKYVTATVVYYSLRYPERIKTKDPATGNYSHNYFERALLKNKELAANYLDLHAQVIKETYLIEGEYQAGDRCVIFCASIDFCSTLVDFLKKKFPHLDVRRFVEDDPYENMLESDIRVTTMGSGGTGHDVPMLTTAIMSVALKTSSGNIQGFGRLRDIPGRTTRFAYLASLDIPKQMEYHEQKAALLNERALVYGSKHIPDPI